MLKDPAATTAPASLSIVYEWDPTPSERGPMTPVSGKAPTLTPSIQRTSPEVPPLTVAVPPQVVATCRDGTVGGTYVLMNPQYQTPYRNVMSVVSW